MSNINVTRRLEEFLQDPENVKMCALLSQKRNSELYPSIMSCLESTKYGWHTIKCNSNGFFCGHERCRKKELMQYPCSRAKIEYKSSNLCDKKQSCRYGIYDAHNPLNTNSIHDIDTAKDYFSIIEKVFFDSEYGNTTLLIFSYCVAGLFKSLLPASISPFYLQINCVQNGLMYELIQEIATICDVNTGIHENCKNVNNLYSCAYRQHETFYPVQADKSIEKIISFKDKPFIIEGHEGNMRNYNALVREMANKSNKDFYLNDVLPIFVCHEPRPALKNFFSMDLIGVQIDEDYLSLIKENKDFLRSIVTHIMERFNGIVFFEKESEDEERSVIETSLSFQSEISASIKEIYPCVTNQKYVKNIGVLKYFFVEIMRAFEMKFSNKFPDNQVFSYKEGIQEKTKTELLAKLNAVDTRLNML